VYILDTNVISNLLRYRYETDLGRKVSSVPAADLWVSVVTVEELLEGRLVAIRRANSEKKYENLPALYSYLTDIIEDIRKFQILPFDEDALKVFQSIPTKIRQRAGTQDCRIAATAISKDFTVVTVNVSDFHLIPNLKVEDWTNKGPDNYFLAVQYDELNKSIPDVGEPIGPGLNSIARITGGQFNFTYNSYNDPSLNERIFTVTGSIERNENNKLVASVTIIPPDVSAQKLIKELRFDNFLAESNDSVLSADPSNPTVFTANVNELFRKGIEIPGVTLENDTVQEFKTTIIGVLKDNVFSGEFETAMNVSEIGKGEIEKAELKGEFKIYLS
jgi:predicted nucleic acid-binding protein